MHSKSILNVETVPLLKFVPNVKSLLMFLFILFYLMQAFYPSDLATMLLGLTTLSILILSFSKVSTSNKILSMMLFFVGLVLMERSGVNNKEWFIALTENAGLISLILSVPMIGFILQYDKFEESIVHVAEKYTKTPLSFYVITTLLTNVIGIFLNLATLPLIQQLFNRLYTRYPHQLFHKAVTRGFGLNLLWSPNFVSVAVVLKYMNLSWHVIVPVGLSLAILGNILTIIIGKITIRQITEQKRFENEQKDIYKNDTYLTFIKLLIILVSIVLLIILLETKANKSILVIVPLVSIISPLLIAIFIKKLQVYNNRFKNYWKVTLPNMNNEVLLFTSIGVFGYGLAASGVNEYIPMIIKSIGLNHEFTLIPFLLLFISGISIIGVHPIITISTIAVALPAHSIPMSEVQMAITMLTGYFLYMLISPFSAVSLVFSGIMKESPLNVSLKLNWLYAICFIVLTTIVLLFV